MQTLKRCLLGLVIVAVASTGAAAVFNVSDPAGFQAALDSAAGNGENDTVNVAAGTYAIATTLSYASGEARTLTIRGAGMGSTILDGGNTTQVLTIDAQSAGAHVTVAEMTLRNGFANGSGGGALLISTGPGDQLLDRVEVTDSNVTGGDDVGGGASAVASTGDVTVTSSRFLRNGSQANVGGLYASSSSGQVTLTASTFADNTVNNLGGSEYFGDGGGAMIYTEGGGQALVEGCAFADNTTGGGSNPDAGGLMIYQLGAGVAATVTASTFRGNLAGLGGGGLFVRMNASGATRVEDNVFTANGATIGGGAGAFIYVDAGNVTVRGNTASRNQAGGEGGGIYISHVQGTTTVTDNTFIANQTGANGGGLHLFTETASATLRGNRYSANTAGNVGGGLSYATTSGSLGWERDSLSGNDTGAYLYLDQPTAPTTVRNLILWGNTLGQLGFDTGTGSGSLTVTYSIAQGSGGEPWFGTGCSLLDPDWVNPAGHDLHLASASSPAVDSGDPASPLDPDGSRADMGALPWDPSYLLEDGFEAGDVSAWSSAVR